MNNESFQVNLAERIKHFLKEEREDEAIEEVAKNKDVMKWRDEEWYNVTLIHYAARYNCNTFLEMIFKDEKVVIIS